jgi:hypothetical protein
VLTVPLKVRSKTAALIYADSAERGEVAINVEAIELLAHTAGLVVELVSLRSRMTEAVQTAKQPAPPPAPQVPAVEPVLATSAGFRSAPLPQTHSTQPEFSAQPEPTGDLQQPAPAPTFFRPSAEPEPVVQTTPPGPSTNGALGEEEKAHNDARRFARLLVSEIKLYNEQKVAEGRRGGDLYDRLKEDIDRSRQMYEKRVTPNVAARFDYFYDELVSTLAEGDQSKLGSDCPGPTVAATT